MHYNTLLRTLYLYPGSLYITTWRNARRKIYTVFQTDERTTWQAAQKRHAECADQQIYLHIIQRTLIIPSIGSGILQYFFFICVCVCVCVCVYGRFTISSVRHRLYLSHYTVLCLKGNILYRRVIKHELQMTEMQLASQVQLTRIPASFLILDILLYLSWQKKANYLGIAVLKDEFYTQKRQRAIKVAQM
jgi:hypothetical protein